MFIFFSLAFNVPCSSNSLFRQSFLLTYEINLFVGNWFTLSCNFLATIAAIIVVQLLLSLSYNCCYHCHWLYFLLSQGAHAWRQSFLCFLRLWLVSFFFLLFLYQCCMLNIYSVSCISCSFLILTAVAISNRWIMPPFVNFVLILTNFPLW